MLFHRIFTRQIPGLGALGLFLVAQTVWGAAPADADLRTDFLQVDEDAARSLELLREGKVREAWERVERGKCLLFERWAGTKLETVPLEDLQIWLGGADASLLIYSDSQRQPLIAFVIDVDEIHGYELGDLWRNSVDPVDLESAGQLQVQAQQVADSWFNTSLIEHVSSATRLFVVPRHGSTRVPLSAAIDLVSATHSDSSHAAGQSRLAHSLGQGPPVSFLPAASFLRGRVSPRMRSGSGFTLFTHNSSTAERLARRKDRVWLGEEAHWGQFEDKDTRDSDVFHFDLPMEVGPLGNDVGLGTPPAFIPFATIAPEIAADWISAFEVAAPDYPSRRSFIYRFLERRSRAIAINMTPLSPETAQEVGDILFAQLRTGLARDEALRTTRRELLARGRSLEDCYAPELWGAGNLPVYALVPPRGIGGLVVAWVLFLVSGFGIVSFIGRRLSPSDPPPAEKSGPEQRSAPMRGPSPPERLAPLKKPGPTEGPSPTERPSR